MKPQQRCSSPKASRAAARRLRRSRRGTYEGCRGVNGAGKSTALNAILGLTPYQGALRVLGRDPWVERDQLTRDVAFIADVAVLPRWIRVSQLLDYAAGAHPRFDRAKALSFLAKTSIKRTSKVRGLSKGCCTTALTASSSPPSATCVRQAWPIYSLR